MNDLEKAIAGMPHDQLALFMYGVLCELYRSDGEWSEGTEWSTDTLIAICDRVPDPCLQAIKKLSVRCQHGMFYTGAGACPACGG